MAPGTNARLKVTSTISDARPHTVTVIEKVLDYAMNDLQSVTFDLCKEHSEISTYIFCHTSPVNTVHLPDVGASSAMLVQH